MLFVNLLCVALAIKVLEVLVRAPDDVGEFQIFQYGRHEADRLMSVCLAEIGIVIDDRFPFLGVLQKFYHTSPQDRVQGIIRAKHENIVFLDLREGHLQPLRRVILVEDIISVLIVVQKSE